MLPPADLATIPERTHKSVPCSLPASQEIAASIEEQGSSMEEVVASSQALAELAERLQEDSRRFRTE